MVALYSVGPVYLRGAAGKLVAGSFFFFISFNIFILYKEIPCAYVCSHTPHSPGAVTFCVLYFQRAACSTFQTCILNVH